MKKLPLVFAADALIRFKSGRMLIHTAGSGMRAFESDDGALIGWLCQFAKPTLPEAALGRLQAADRAAIAPALDYLKRSGVLVEVDALGVNAPGVNAPGVEAPGLAAPVSASAAAPDDAETLSRTKQHLRLLARSFYDTACDILSFGPHAERELQKTTGTGVERRLMALLAATDGLRSALGNLRRGYVASQLAALQVRPGDREQRLHIGCGAGRLDGWINIDIYPAPLSLNVMWGLPFADGSVSYIFVSHLLEHLFFPRDVKPFLEELRRVLAPGGVVRIVVPDIEQCIEAYVGNDRSFFGNRRETWAWWPKNPTRLEDFLAYSGAGAEPAYLFESHKYGYDFETLTRVLSDAGFAGITRSGFMASEHAALQVDEVSAVANAKYGDRYYSLFVEARRPPAT